MSAKIPLRILNIVNHRETSDHPMFMVVLTESEGDRRLPIIIGQPEAQAIAYSLDNFTPNRPLTHDLVHTLCDLFNIDLVEVVITKIEAGVFHAMLVCKKGDAVIEIDSRTSDALALAVRFDAPIFAYDEVLDASGISLEDIQRAEQLQDEVEMDDELDDGPDIEELTEAVDPSASPAEQDLSDLSMETLNEMLAEAVRNEDYERAARIRDEISRR